MKRVTIPEIRFRNGWLLTKAFVSYQREIERFKNTKPPSEKQMEKIIEERRKLWKKWEKKIIPAMQKIAGLNFYQNIIDVYTVFGWKSAFSNPMVLSIKYEGDLFIDTLAHEMLHRLITDNIQKKNGTKWAAATYPKIKDPVVLNHILVHAIHKEIYLSVLKNPERLASNLERADKNPPYKRAWQIVEKEGHLNIINKFKKSKKI